MRRQRIAGLGAAFLFASLFAQPCFSEGGQTGAPTLKRPIGSRATALAEAYSAVDSGPDAMGYNPAGLSFLKRPTFETSYTHGIIDDHFGFAGYAHPLARGTIAAGMMYYDAGKIQVTLSNGLDEPRNAQQDMVGLAALGMPVGWGLAVGGTFKAYRFTIADEARSGGWAADAGALWHTPLKGLNFGAAVQNMGPDVKFEREGDPLPLTTRAGAAYLLDLSRFGAGRDLPYSFTRFQFSADLIKVKHEKTAAGAGLEMVMPLGEKASAALRGGYVFNRDLDSMTVGIGLRESRFFFDYAFGMKRALNNVHHFSFGVQF